MKDEIKEILDYFKRSNKNKLGFEQDKIITYKEANQLLDYITNLQQKLEYYENIDPDKTIDKFRQKINREMFNLQEENTKKDNVINGIEEFIEYLDRETNVYLVNTAYTVILGKLKKLKIDNGLLQGSDNND